MSDKEQSKNRKPASTPKGMGYIGDSASGGKKLTEATSGGKPFVNKTKQPPSNNQK